MNAFDSKLLDGKTKLHFVGIGGSGMFPLVQILHEVGYEITGSDVNEGDIIDRERKLGIPISMGHKAENVHGAELVVYTAAIMKGNPEIEEAHRLGIPTVERSILLGYVANTYPHPICIAGTHGKTTTTAMTTQIMVMAHADPAAVIGGKLPLIDAYGRYGTGREIVVEACEYSNTFLHLVPYISVLLNVDADHLEFFKTMENLEESFRKFALLTTHTVIANLDDANTVKVIHNLDRHIRTIGIDTPADYRAVHVREYRPSFFCFDVQVLGVPAVHIELSVPGRHNVYNALAAFACATMSGCTADECARGINAFRRLRPSPHRVGGHAARRQGNGLQTRVGRVPALHLHPHADAAGRFCPGAADRGQSGDDGDHGQPGTRGGLRRPNKGPCRQGPRQRVVRHL